MAEVKNTMTLDSKPFTSELDRAMGRVKGFGVNVGKAIAGAFAAKQIMDYALATVKAAQETENLAERVNLGVESVQSLQVVAKQAGLSFGDFESALQSLNTKQVQAINGNEAAAKSFAVLGISVDELQGMNLEQTMEAVAKAMKDNAGNSKATEASLALLGGSSMKLNAALMQLADGGFAALNKGMLDSSQIAAGEMNNRLARLGDSVDVVTNKAKTLGKTLVDAFAVGLSAPSALLGALSAGATFEEAKKIAVGVGQGGVVERPNLETPVAVEADRARSAAQDAFIELSRRIDIQKKSNADQMKFWEAERDVFERGSKFAETYEMRLDFLRKMVDAEKEIARLQDDENRKASEAQDRESEAARKRIKDRNEAMDAEAERARDIADIQEKAGVAGYGSGASLEKIGGFTGSGDSGTITALERQIRIAEQIRDYQRRTAETLERTRPLTIGGE
jgi:hypothetical protein